MRDIDFEELDKAVGSYLENGVVPNSKEENNEVFSKIENQIEHSREQQKMVFARKAPQSANQLHYNNGKKQIRNIKKVSENPKNEKKAISGKPKVRILDDFSAPVPPEHHRGNFGMPFSAKEEKIAFESPILETYGGEKLARNIKKLENSPIRKKNVLKNEKTQVKMGNRTQPQEDEIKPILGQKTTTSNRAEFYAGVYRIGDDDNKLRVFHGERAVEIPERRPSGLAFEHLKLENESEKVMPEISSIKTSDKTVTPLNNFKEIQKEIEGVVESEASKIEVKTDLKKQPELIEEKNEKKIEIFKIDEKANETADQEEVSGKIIIQPVDESEKPKTLFLQNPQIEKRPLGMNRNRAESFEFKMPASNHEQKPTAIIKELRQAKLSTPILSSDEYSTPVKHRKKSGWGIVLAIFAILLLGAGAGFVAYLVAFQ